MTTVTPYLPKEADLTAKAWLASGKPAFLKAHEQRLHECPNCQGIGFITLMLIDSGPYNSFIPAGKTQVVTWFDGSENNGRGWYIIDETKCYVCPECNGETGKYAVKDENYMPLEVLAIQMQAHKPIIEELAKKMSAQKRKRYPETSRERDEIELIRQASIVKAAK